MEVTLGETHRHPGDLKKGTGDVRALATANLERYLAHIEQQTSVRFRIINIDRHPVGRSKRPAAMIHRRCMIADDTHDLLFAVLPDPTTGQWRFYKAFEAVKHPGVLEKLMPYIGVNSRWEDQCRTGRFIDRRAQNRATTESTTPLTLNDVRHALQMFWMRIVLAVMIRLLVRNHEVATATA
jgi:hypothetical protein